MGNGLKTTLLVASLTAFIVPVGHVAGGGIGLLAVAILGPIAALLIQMAISRSREYLADSVGARTAGSPWGLAGALEKLAVASRQVPLQASPATANMFIINPLTGGGITAFLSTHPPIERRIERLRKMGYRGTGSW